MDRAQRIAGKFYCAACSRFFFSTAELPMPESLTKPDPEAKALKRAPNTVKWWDAARGEWRWVSKRSKPKLEPK